MFSCIGAALTVLSYVGSWEFIRRRAKVDVHFLPSIVIAVQVSILFLAGILNMLLPAALGLFIFGAVYLLVCIVRDRGIGFLRSYLTVGYAFCLITLCVMAVFLRGKLFTIYDNFSHWALVAKCLLTADRFPTFRDTLILFQAYPLGSTTYIYYFSKFISTAESVQMLAQVYVIIAAVMPVFAFASRNRALALLSVLSFTNLFFVYNCDMTSLTVDTLLPVVGACAFLFAYLYCGKDSVDTLPLYISAAYLIFLIQIKNSGIFFAAFAALWLLFPGRKALPGRHRIASALIPFASLFIWQAHYKYVFPNGQATKHAMSINNYRGTFLSRPLDTTKTIVVSFLKFTVTYADVWLCFAAMLVVGLIIFLLCRPLGRTWLGVFLFSVVLFLCYQIGTMAMYLCSMADVEALVLESADRYTRTILIAILYLTLVLFVLVLSELTSSKLRSLAVCVIAVFIPFFVMKLSIGTYPNALQYRENASMRTWLASVCEEYEVPEGESYSLLINDPDWGYSSFLMHYLFYTEKANSVIVDDAEKLDNISSKYIFVYNPENEITQTWIMENYPDQIGSRILITEN